MKLPGLWWLPFGRVPEVSASELKRWLEDGHPIQIVDARTVVEYQQGTVGRARHASLTEMPDSIKRLDLDPACRTVVLCLSGHRSRPGVRWLRARGFEAHSLQGGIMAWRRSGFELHDPFA
jgi:rhodanese-related sulfurtransferase